MTQTRMRRMAKDRQAAAFREADQRLAALAPAQFDYRTLYRRDCGCVWGHLGTRLDERLGIAPEENSYLGGALDTPPFDRRARHYSHMTERQATGARGIREARRRLRVVASQYGLTLPALETPQMAQTAKAEKIYRVIIGQRRSGWYWQATDAQGKTRLAQKRTGYAAKRTAVRGARRAAGARVKITNAE